MTSRGGKAHVFVTILSVLVLAGCTPSSDDLATRWSEVDDREYISGDGSVQSVPPEERVQAVAFSGTLDTGASLSSADLQGTVSVLNFWYAACPPCQAEAPDLAAADRMFAPDGVQFFGINAHDDEQSSLQFAEHFDIGYPSALDALDDRSIQRAFVDEVPLNAMPTTLILDREGRVSHRIIGQIVDVEGFHQLIEEVLEEE